jgi:hypothetical protein
MLNADAAPGARRIAEQIRSGRKTEGAYSVYSRIRTDQYIDALANKIARAYPNGIRDGEELRRAVLTQERQTPDQFWTNTEIGENLRLARQRDAAPIPVRDLNRHTLAKMTAIERLNLVNTGEISTRFKVLEPGQHE